MQRVISARAAGLPRKRVEAVYNPVITPQLLEQARQRPDHPWYEPGQPPVILGVGRLTGGKRIFQLCCGHSPRCAATATHDF